MLTHEIFLIFFATLSLQSILFVLSHVFSQLSLILTPYLLEIYSEQMNYSSLMYPIK